MNAAILSGTIKSAYSEAVKENGGFYVVIVVFTIFKLHCTNTVIAAGGSYISKL